MKITAKHHCLSVATLATLALTTAACGGEEDGATGTDDTSTSVPADDEMESTQPGAEPMTGPVGPGCADYAAMVPEGAGSVAGMAQDPVATAASNNPLLTTLVAAVSGNLNPQVNLVDTLNGAEFTVFAPVDEAFAQIDAGTIETLKSDADLLTTILTYHVVAGQLSPEEVVGDQTTVQGEAVTVGGLPDALMVNDANVICGGVTTANATVYLIDGVLMPPAG
ncbi:MAG: fasciclin domain-containing protein [Jiangellaceae bacterium]